MSDSPQPPQDKAAPRVPLYADIVVGLYFLSMPLQSLLVLQSEDEVGYFTFSKLVGYLLLLVAILNKRLFFSRRPWASGPLLFYFAVVVISGLQLTIGSVPWEQFLQLAGTMVQSIIVFHLLYSYFSFRSPRVFWWYAAGCGAVGAIEVLHILPSYIQTDRNVMFGDDPNRVASSYALSVIMLIYLAILKWMPSKKYFMPSRLGRILAVIGIPIVLMSIVDSGSRGGMMACLAGITALIMLHRATKVPLVLKIALLIIVCAGIYRMVMSSESLERWSDTIHFGDTAGRSGIYASAWGLIKEHPVFGCGIVQNWYMLGEAVGFFSKGVMFRGTHNQFLQVFSSLGLVGFIPYLLFLWRCLRPAKERFSRDGDALALALFICLATVCMSLDWDNQKQYWMILAFSASMEAPGGAMRTG